MTDLCGAVVRLFPLVWRRVRWLNARSAAPFIFALLGFSVRAQAQVLVIDSSPQTRIVAESLAVQFASEAKVELVTTERGSSAGVSARRFIEQGRARLVLWIGTDDEVVPPRTDYIVSVASTLPDGPGLEVRRIHAETGPIGDRSLSLRIAEVYPAAPPVRAPGGGSGKRDADHGVADKNVPADWVADGKRRPWLVGGVIWGSSAGRQLSLGASLAHAFPLEHFHLEPGLTVAFTPEARTLDADRQLLVRQWAFGATLESHFRFGQAIELGPGALLDWKLRTASGASFTSRGSATEWTPSLVPYIGARFRPPRSSLWVGTALGLSWALIRQHWQVGGEVLESDARFSLVARLAVGFIIE